jgi:hypothetical protein
MPASACVLLPEEKINNGALFFSEAGLADLAMDIPKAGGNSDRGMGDRGIKFTGPHSSVPSGGLADFILCGSCILWLKIFAFSAFFCAKAVSINHIAIFFPKSCGGRHVLGGKAVEGHRSPRRFALTQAIVLRASVLDCASPLALWSGPSNTRPCRMMRYFFCRNALKQFQSCLAGNAPPIPAFPAR